MLLVSAMILKETINQLVVEKYATYLKLYSRKIFLMENFDILAKFSCIIYAFFCNFEDRTR
jgi:hypothetical protein